MVEMTMMMMLINGDGDEDNIIDYSIHKQWMRKQCVEKGKMNYSTKED